MDSKIHVRVVLDVSVTADSSLNICDVLKGGLWALDAHEVWDETVTVEDVSVVDAVVTDSR